MEGAETDWINRLAAALGESDGTELTEAETGALLDAARDVAHGTGDRRNAPLACFVLGRWVGARVAAGASGEAALSEGTAALTRILAAPAD